MEENNKFHHLVEKYGEHDAQLKEIKNLCDGEKDLIKGYMLEHDLHDYTSDTYKVTRTESTRETFNEEKALNVIKKWLGDSREHYYDRFINKIEVLNMDAIEEALYNHEFDENVISELDGCRNKTEVVTLKCSKRKGK